MAEAMAEGEVGGAPPKLRKSNMVLIVIVAVLATIVVGGGVAAVFVLKSAGSHSSAATDTAAQADTKGGQKEKHESNESKGPPIYVPMEPPFVVNFDPSQSVRFLQVTVQLMTRDSDTSKLLKDNDPLVRNDLLMLFGNQSSTALATKDGKEALRKQALDTVRAVVKNVGGKPDLVEAVYFTTFVMQ